jgi:spore germination protein YaaH
VMPQTSALLIEIAIIGALAIVGWLLWRKFVMHPKLAKKYHDYAVKEGDNIQQIAKNNNVKWKHLAQINNIKAPYALDVGSIIKVPNKPDIANTEKRAPITNDIQEKPIQAVAQEEKPTPKKASQAKKTKSATKPKKKAPAKKKPTPKKKPAAKKKPIKKEQ